MLSSKHLGFNPSVFGFRDKNLSPAGTLLVSSRVFFWPHALALWVIFLNLLLDTSYRFVSVTV